MHVEDYHTCDNPTNLTHEPREKNNEFAYYARNICSIDFVSYLQCRDVNKFLSHARLEDPSGAPAFTPCF
jgi:hypothetical protein